MKKSTFNPFNDRKSRDIRNSLSTAFIEAIQKGSFSVFRDEGEKWLSDSPETIYAGYIHERLQRCGKAFQEIKSSGKNGLLPAAFVLWNHELFFEFHECLESIWLNSESDARSALKGLIQAAGYYIHMHRGRPKTAMRLGARAVRRLSENRKSLACIANIDELLRSIEAGALHPVRLQADRSCVEKLMQDLQ